MPGYGAITIVSGLAYGSYKREKTNIATDVSCSDVQGEHDSSNIPNG